MMKTNSVHHFALLDFTLSMTTGPVSHSDDPQTHTIGLLIDTRTHVVPVHVSLEASILHPISRSQLLDRT
jgi:hypothetical protein